MSKRERTAWGLFFILIILSVYFTCFYKPFKCWIKGKTTTAALQEAMSSEEGGTIYFPMGTWTEINGNLYRLEQKSIMQILWGEEGGEGQPYPGCGFGVGLHRFSEVVKLKSCSNNIQPCKISLYVCGCVAYYSDSGWEWIRFNHTQEDEK